MVLGTGPFPHQNNPDQRVVHRKTRTLYGWASAAINSIAIGQHPGTWVLQILLLCKQFKDLLRSYPYLPPHQYGSPPQLRVQTGFVSKGKDSA